MAETHQPFEFSIIAKDTPQGVQTQVVSKGEPKSPQEYQAVMMNIAARPLVSLYESWLLGSHNEDKMDTRAFFFVDHQAMLLRIFMDMIGSEDFQSYLKARRKAIEEAGVNPSLNKK